MRRLLSALRFGAVYLLVWIAIWVSYTSLIYFQSVDRSLAGAATGAGFSSAAAALLGLVAWFASRWLARHTRQWPRIIGAHLVMATLLTFLWTWFNVASIASHAPAELPYFMARAIGWHAFSGMCIFGMIALAAHVAETNLSASRQRQSAERADALRAKAELAALRAQLNPHFLFNTLHSITALVRRDPGGAEEALERLGELLRHVLELGSRDSDIISLAEEWDVVSRQLELERLRFGERLRIVSDISDDALDCAVPMLTLQPLVENALRHGIASLEAGGIITVTGHVDGDHLVISVADDGVGSEPATLVGAGGVGLTSIRQRLVALYGPRATLTMSSPKGEGVRATMRLPVTAAPTRAPAPKRDAEVVCAS